MSDYAGNPGPDYMRRFALVTILSVAIAAFLLLGFQDSIRSIGGGLVLAAPCLMLFGFMTFYNMTHTGGMVKYATIASFVLDFLLLVFLVLMLTHIKQEEKIKQAATGLLVHLPRSGISNLS